MSDGLQLGPFDESQMRQAGRALGAWLDDQPTGIFIGLRGDLGAGKSVLARAVAAGAGVQASMPSPTFNLVFRYATSRGRTLAHLDLYRLNDPDEVWELGWEELSRGDEIALVEWPERAQALLPADRWEITLTRAADAEQRIVSVWSQGEVPAFPDEVVSAAVAEVRG